MEFFCAYCNKHRPNSELVIRNKKKRCKSCNDKAKSNFIKSKAS